MTTSAAEAPGRHLFTGGDPRVALKEDRWVIEQAIINHPRSLQSQIGPSEIGTPCDHCLAAKLALWQETEPGVPWLPTVGTAMHAWLEEQFSRYEATHDGGPRYLTEARVMVGSIGETEIWGSTDLVDLVVGMTVDWKLVGPTTLKTAKVGPTPTYRAQGHLYAKGWRDAGYRIDHVAIAFLPRNANGLDHAVWWTEPYDEQIAVAALERANQIFTNLTALTTLGDVAVTAWIEALPRDPHCWDCARYPDSPTPTRGRGPFDDLVVVD